MKRIVVLGISSLFILGCSNNPDKVIAQHEAETHAGGEAEVHKVHGVQLNEGRKWVTNAEMRPFLEEGSELVNRYLDNDQTDYQRLAADLKDRNSKLIASCTMKGESHEELHKWLEPHLKLTDSLGKASDEARARIVAAEIRRSYGEYHTYFQ